MKKISIIMATYKTNKDMLMESINSILNQTYTNFEFIIVCDGDLEEYNFLKTIEDSRIKLLKNEKNLGLAYSLNRAIEVATGDYIARMDSDDISLPNRLENQLKYLEEHKDIYLCSTYATTFGDNKGTIKLFLKSHEQLNIQLLYRSIFIHPTVMGRSNVFKKYKYNEEFNCAQDFELWSRIENEYKFAIIPKIMLKYRIHKKQSSFEKREIQKNLTKKIISNNCKKISGIFDEKIYDCLCVFGGLENLNKENYLKIDNEIDYIIEENKKNKKYNEKELKKVLYNRFFELIIKNRIFTLNLSVLKKCFKWYNLKDLVFKIVG